MRRRRRREPAPPPHPRRSRVPGHANHDAVVQPGLALVDGLPQQAEDATLGGTLVLADQLGHQGIEREPEVVAATLQESVDRLPVALGDRDTVTCHVCSSPLGSGSAFESMIHPFVGVVHVHSRGNPELPACNVVTIQLM